MTTRPDHRFETQRTNVHTALQALKQSVTQPVKEPRDLSGIIKDFEIVYELSWKALKTFLENQGHETTSARDAFSKAYQLGFVREQHVWLEMINDRNLTVHTYDRQLAKAMCDRIRQKYSPAFQTLFAVLTKKRKH